MKKSTHSNRARKETAASTSGGKQDQDYLMTSVKQFFGEYGLPSFSSAKDKSLLKTCEQYLEYNRRDIDR